MDIQNDTLTRRRTGSYWKKYISDINGLTVEYGLTTEAHMAPAESGQQG